MLRASRLHDIGRRILRDRMTSLGFRAGRGTGRASWRRTEEGVETDLIVVPSATNFSQGRGRFTIDLSEWDPVEHRSGGYPLTFLLDDDQRERLRGLIDEVRRRMPPPDPDLLDHLSDDERRWYLSAFDPVGAPFLPAQDVWFEYVDEEDAAAAFTFVAEVRPSCLAALTRVGIEEHARRSAPGADDDGWHHLGAGLDAVMGAGRPGPHDDPGLERLLALEAIGADAEVSSARIGPGSGLTDVLRRLGIPHRLVTAADASSDGLFATVYSVPGAHAADLLDAFVGVVPRPPSGTWSPRTVLGIPVLVAEGRDGGDTAMLGAVDGRVFWLVGDATRVRRATALLVQRLQAEAFPTASVPP